MAWQIILSQGIGTQKLTDVLNNAGIYWSIDNQVMNGLVSNPVLLISSGNLNDTVFVSTHDSLWDFIDFPIRHEVAIPLSSMINYANNNWGNRADYIYLRAYGERADIRIVIIAWA